MMKQLIPERDTGSAPRGPQPKPRSRRAHDVNDEDKLSSKLLDEVIEDDEITYSSLTSSIESGLDNLAYVHNENEGEIDGDSLKQLAKSAQIPVSKYNTSSDSEVDQKVKQHTFEAQVHGPNNGEHYAGEVSQGTSEWKRNPHPSQTLDLAPKPKPRSRRTASESESYTTDSSALVSPEKNGVVMKKEDYLIVTIPENPNFSSAEKPIESETKLRSIKENARSYFRSSKGHKPDIAIDMDESKDKEEIEMQNLSKTTDIPDKQVTESSIEYISETPRGKRTKAMLRRDEPKEIERLKTMLSPIKTLASPSKSVSSPSKRERRRAEKSVADNKHFGVTIHFCDLLPVDPNIVHPVVKVSLLNEDGTCIPQSKIMEANILDRRHSSPAIVKPGDKRQKKRKGKTQSPGDDDKSSRKRKNSTGNKSIDREKVSMNPKLGYKLTTKSILPIMTQPCKLSYHLPTFAPYWNELLVFDEPFNLIVHPDSTTILFLEIMDFLPPGGPQKTSRLWNGYHGSEEGWYKIAWGFLKLVGANGSRNVNRKLRLQLFKPESIPSKLKIDGMSEVYQWWKLKKQRKIDATICITVRAVVANNQNNANLNTLLSMEKEELSQAILGSQIESNTKGDQKGLHDAKNGNMEVKIPQWSRLDGQSCKIPNKILKKLPESQMESLNMGVSGNVYCVKFSPCGLKLAAGLHTDDFHTILIFEIPSGKLVSNIRCHYGLIYDLDWKILDTKNNAMPKSYYLAAASADSVASIWEFKSPTNSCKLLKKLLHPSFVYSVKFHPSKTHLVFTGCFDCAIRVWDISKMSPSKANLHNAEVESVPVSILSNHTSYVNCMVFGLLGNHLYTGDGSGFIFEWVTRSSGRKRTWTKTRELCFKEAGKSPVNSLDIHPNGNRLLVHVRNSLLKIIDISSFLVLQNYNGLVNDKLQIHSCFSPCGNLVLSGSEDGMICFWDADTGSIMQFLAPENHKNAIVTCVHYHPHDHFVAVGFASTISEPSPVVLYAYKTSRNAKLRFQTLTRLATWNSAADSALPVLNDDDLVKGRPSFQKGMPWGDSSDKFMMIVKKLDSALKVTRKKSGHSEGGSGGDMFGKNGMVNVESAGAGSVELGSPGLKMRSPVTDQSPHHLGIKPSKFAQNGGRKYGGEYLGGIGKGDESFISVGSQDNRKRDGEEHKEDLETNHIQAPKVEDETQQINAVNSRVRQKRREKMRLTQHFDEVRV